MRDVVESFLNIANRYGGVPNTADVADWVVAGIAVVPVFSFSAWLYLYLRRSRGDIRAISSELEAVRALIKTDTRGQLNRVIDDVGRLHEDLKNQVRDDVNALHGMLKSTEQIADREPDKDIAPDTSGSSRRVRLNLVENVRRAVLEKWVEGRTLSRAARDPNCYVFHGRSESGELIDILLQTPYRASIGSDGRMPFTIELWVDKYKKLNFEWDSDGRYALRGYKPGDWFAEIAEWALTPIEADAEPGSAPTPPPPAAVMRRRA